MPVRRSPVAAGHSPVPVNHLPVPVRDSPVAAGHPPVPVSHSPVAASRLPAPADDLPAGLDGSPPLHVDEAMRSLPAQPPSDPRRRSHLSRDPLRACRGGHHPADFPDTAGRARARRRSRDPAAARRDPVPDRGSATATIRRASTGRRPTSGTYTAGPAPASRTRSSRSGGGPTATSSPRSDRRPVPCWSSAPTTTPSAISDPIRERTTTPAASRASWSSPVSSTAAVLSSRIDLVAYANEEPPWFGSPWMGSAVHARSLKGQDVRGMICLEMIGYFTETQPAPNLLFRLLYPIARKFHRRRRPLERPRADPSRQAGDPGHRLPRPQLHRAPGRRHRRLGPAELLGSGDPRGDGDGHGGRPEPALPRAGGYGGDFGLPADGGGGGWGGEWGDSK